jgi:hypothetical protein
VAELQGYLVPSEHGAGSSCRCLYALALLFPPKLSSHTHGTTMSGQRQMSAEGRAELSQSGGGRRHGLGHRGGRNSYTGLPPREGVGWAAPARCLSGEVPPQLPRGVAPLTHLRVLREGAQRGQCRRVRRHHGRPAVSLSGVRHQRVREAPREAHEHHLITKGAGLGCKTEVNGVEYIEQKCRLQIIPRI